MGVDVSKTNRETCERNNIRDRWDDQICKRRAYGWSCWALGSQFPTKLYRKCIQNKWIGIENRGLSTGENGWVAVGTWWR